MKTGVKEKTILTAENVEVNLDDLRIAQCVSYHPLVRERAHQRIIEAVIRGLESPDRERLEDDMP